MLLIQMSTNIRILSIQCITMRAFLFPSTCYSNRSLIPLWRVIVVGRFIWRDFWRDSSSKNVNSLEYKPFTIDGVWACRCGEMVYYHCDTLAFYIKQKLGSAAADDPPPKIIVLSNKIVIPSKLCKALIGRLNIRNWNIWPPKRGTWRKIFND